jgi:hypothetical protein
MLLSPRFRNRARLQKAAENAPPLKQGETSDGVRALQEALVHLGHSMPASTKADDFDGIYCSETAATVRRFQQTHALSVDGVAGHQTLTTMDQIFLLDDPFYQDPNLERAAFWAQLNGPSGRGPLCCTTARKNKNEPA